MESKPEDVKSALKSRIPKELIEKGLQNPSQIPPFVIGQLFPDSKWAPNWYEHGGYVMFEDGGFAGGDPSRPELSARIYREVKQLRTLLPDREYDRSLEVGCGYGRMSGWIADSAESAVGIDPNERALRVARTMYPELDFVATGAEELPFPDDSFDLVVSWAVLQHVPPRAIERATEEIRRVLADGGTILLSEKTSGAEGRATWVRSTAEYESLFEPCKLQARAVRSAEPTYEYALNSETIIFDHAGAPQTGSRGAESTPSMD